MTTIWSSDHWMYQDPGIQNPKFMLHIQNSQPWKGSPSWKENNDHQNCWRYVASTNA